METNFEKYRNGLMENPEFRAYYVLAKEKLNMELMIDSIEDAIDKNQSQLTMKRRVSKLKKYIAAISL